MTNQSTQLNLPIPEDISDEDVDISVPEEKRKINAIPSDQEIHSIVHKWQNGILILQPDFQRYYVWDEKKASRLIESALLSVPLPLIYLSEGPIGNLSVIDGQQRLHTFISFIHGKYIHNNKPFVLKDLKVFKELNGLSFKNIPAVYQNRLRYFTLRVVTIKSDSDPRLKHEIFERLNTGAVALNNMELRNCLNQGRFLTLLKELSAYAPFRELLGLQDADPRMRDVELVLRFAAFYHHGYTGYSSPMKKFLNDEMEKYQNISDEDAKVLRKKFKTAVMIIQSLFGENAFHRYAAGKEGAIDGSWESKTFNAALFDVYMNVFSNKDRNQVQKSADLIREAIIDLMASNQDFREAILLATSNTDRVRKRFQLLHQLIDDILAKKTKQPRLFSFEIKKRLYDTNPVCELCGQHIVTIDDAAVDHIEQYWKGGQTTANNAQLTHRYCNNSRPRNDP